MTDWLKNGNSEALAQILYSHLLSSTGVRPSCSTKFCRCTGSGQGLDIEIGIQSTNLQGERSRPELACFSQLAVNFRYPSAALFYERLALLSRELVVRFCFLD